MVMDMNSVNTKGKTDGRKQRSARSRDKIKTSIITLIRSGNYLPRAFDISEHSRLSMRTVFRHIDDMESLLREIAADCQEEILLRFLKPYVSTEWQAQLDERIARRAEIWEFMMPVRISVALRRFDSDFLKEMYQRTIDLERASLQANLPEKMVADAALFAALNQAMGISCWISLRLEQGLSRDEAETVVRRTVDALILSAE